MKGRAVTLREVAEAAGVSTFTVSQALRGKGEVRASTRERVVKVARELGYVANAAASLMAQQRGAAGQRGIAVGLLVETNWVHERFKRLCVERGLQGHAFRPSDFASPEAASRTLWSRGLSGLVVNPDQMPWTAGMRKRFDWSRFSLVRMSRGLPDISCHLVRHSAFDYMALTLKKVLEHGYRRIAVVLMRSDSAEDDDARHGALLSFRERKLPPGALLECRELAGNQPAIMDEAVRDWLRLFKPDAIVGYHWTMIYGLNQQGWRFPEDAGFAAVLTDDSPIPNTAKVSGCKVQADEQYRRALDLLLELIGRNERGFPLRPMEHVVEPVWIEGETLPDRGSPSTLNAAQLGPSQRRPKGKD